MNSSTRAKWDESDFELEREFAVEIEAWREHRGRAAQGVLTRSVERNIRSRARIANAGRGAERNWLLGQAPQLALGALILFGVATVFALLPSPSRVVDFKVDSSGEVLLLAPVEDHRRAEIMEKISASPAAGVEGRYRIRLQDGEVTTVDGAAP